LPETSDAIKTKKNRQNRNLQKTKLHKETSPNSRETARLTTLFRVLVHIIVYQLAFGNTDCIVFLAAVPIRPTSGLPNACQRNKKASVCPVHRKFLAKHFTMAMLLAILNFIHFMISAI